MDLGRNGSSAIDAIARGLASGMSRREALRRGGAALLGATAIGPADAWAAVTGKCPQHRVHCGHSCCPVGEVCLPPLRKGGKHRCGCPPHMKRCSGRCVHVTSDARNCGRCGHACGRDQVCAHGTCVTECPSGLHNCNGGCVNLATDPHNCGACGHACAGNEVCQSGRCTVVCASGQTNCSGACVDVHTDVHNCGACGTVCTPGPNVESVTCASGACLVGMCATGFGNCDGEFSTGCEAPLNTVENCGACGNTCAAPNVSQATCSAGNCAITSCAAGFVDCDGTFTSGCECEGTACCGTGCQTKHSNGTGQHFFDCTALNTYNQTQAIEACVANTGDPSKCSQFVCAGDSSVHMICSTVSAGSPCWGYAGTNSGHVSPTGNCPAAGDPTWN